MKVLHVVYTYEPDPIGGTEVYVKQLCEQLALRGVQSAIAAPGSKETVSHETTKLYRYTIDPKPSYAVLYGGGDQVALEGFKKVIDGFQPDLVNFHSVSPANSYLLFEFCKRRGLPLVLTFHTPAMVCQRGDMLYCGKEICRQFLDPNRCTRCYLSTLTKNQAAGSLLAGFSSVLRKDAQKLSGRFDLALHMRDLIELRLAQSRKIIEMVDRIVCPAQWVTDILLQNQVPPSKLVFSRQGITVTEKPQVKKAIFGKRFIFLGRLDPLKGLHILLQALENVSDPDFKLDLYTIIQADNAYAKKIRQLVAKDKRVQILPPVTPGSVVNLIAQYDALLVPSQWLETGPLVVLEAFAARTPVVGSALGSISELIQDGHNGFLVGDYRSPQAWADKMNYLFQNPQLFADSQARIIPPKTMSEVADEMVAAKAALPVREKSFSKKFLFLGRLDPLKGAHVLLGALRKIPDLDIKLDLYTIVQTNNTYAKKIRQLALQDKRIRLLDAVASEKIVELIAEYDVLLVPSQVLETGPLVVLESFAARTPVIGSNLGSIAELIQNEHNGFLVNDYRSEQAWADTIARLFQNPQRLTDVRAQIISPRTMNQVAAERVSIYLDILKP